MKIWFPYAVGRSGSDVHTEILSDHLTEAHHQAVQSPFPTWTQFIPDLLRLTKAPDDADAMITNTRNGFAFARRGVPMVTIEHLFVHGGELRRHRSRAQGIYYDHLLKRYVMRSLDAASRIVAPSEHTRGLIEEARPDLDVQLIRHGVDTQFFTPDTVDRSGQTFRILFVGNFTIRKGADLLPALMRHLGDGYELAYTSGLRRNGRFDVPNSIPLGRLDKFGVRNAYRKADVLICPTRLETGPLVAMEAMACGLPVVGSNRSSMPEVVVHGETGLLSDLNPTELAESVRTLATDSNLRKRMGEAARRRAVAVFDSRRMANQYLELLRDVTGQAGN